MNKIVVPGGSGANIVPMTHEMVAQLWDGMPKMIGQVMRGLTITNTQLEQCMNIMLEHTILIRHLAKSMEITLPTPMEVRQMIHDDRVAFLKKALAADDLPENMKERIRAELLEMETKTETPSDTKEPTDAGSGADQAGN